MGLLFNFVNKSDLQPGDHIYSWRTWLPTVYFYAHHGIYMADNKVIHFTSGNVKFACCSCMSILSIKSRPIRCKECGIVDHLDTGVVMTCLNCFLDGFPLERYQYSVRKLTFILSRGTCTMAAADPSEVVVQRANYLLDNGFGEYDLFHHNCENFATYCKTGLVELGRRLVGRSEQTQRKGIVQELTDERELVQIAVEDLAINLGWAKDAQNCVHDRCLPIVGS